MWKRAGNETLPKAFGISYGSAGGAPGKLKVLAILIAHIVQRAAIEWKGQLKCMKVQAISFSERSLE